MTRNLNDLAVYAAHHSGGPALSAWPVSPGGKLKPGKGGGGDGGASRMEQERQARINAAVSQVNSIFDQGDKRNALYDQQRSAVTGLNSREVDRQWGEAERQNRFGLARSGLIGGSADVDSSAELQRRTNEGLMKAAGAGDQAAADLQTADERSRQNLISMAQSGIDTGTAAQMALSQLDANANNAASARSGSNIGALFGDLANAYLMQQQLSGSRAGAAMYGNQWKAGMANDPSKSYQGS
ncbi:hypothetical protein [Bordetella avium]|uniref:hypothetical protein n=1 Tax=Bordetella avium TaxID=521 RepID=UPI00068EA692|nr:hypothetical protein [Bordetella avium]AZY49591.1 hypothetical protein C0J09_10920 [Bordetella avium]